MERINTNLRFHLASDPFYFEVQNLPLKGLLSNDEVLQFRVDQIQAQLDSLTGRDTFSDLKPYLDDSNPGKIYVKPGSFIARVNIPADRDNGLRERINSGENDEASRGKVVAQPETLGYGINDTSGGVARTALIRLLQDGGIDPNVSISDFQAADYPGGDNASNKNPVYRLDLVFVEAYPAEDQDNGRPRLGVIQGGYFLDFPDTVASERKSGDRFTDSSELAGRSLLQQSKDLNEGNIIDEKKGGIAGQEDRLKYTTVVSPDDLKNYIFRPTDLVNAPSFTDSDSDVPSDLQLAEWAEQQFENRGTFCLPICYVLVPFGYIANTPLSNSNLVDIRPFFRTAEMTFDERQALAASYRPSLTNRLLTRNDPDYTTLRNDIVKGSGLTGPGNHEGRIGDIENSLPMSTHSFDTNGQIVLLNNDYGGETSLYTFYGTNGSDLDITIPYEVFSETKVDRTRIRGLVVRLDTYLKSSGPQTSIRLITSVKKPSLDGYIEIGDQATYVIGRQSTMAFIPVDNDNSSELTFDARFTIQGGPDVSDPPQCRIYVIGVYY